CPSPKARSSSCTVGTARSRPAPRGAASTSATMASPAWGSRSWSGSRPTTCCSRPPSRIPDSSVHVHVLVHVCFAGRRQLFVVVLGHGGGRGSRVVEQGPVVERPETLVPP